MKRDVFVALSGISRCRQSNDLDSLSTRCLSRKLPSLGKLAFGSHFHRLGTFDPQLNWITRANNRIEGIAL